jgi:hypothetical protein
MPNIKLPTPDTIEILKTPGMTRQEKKEIKGLEIAKLGGQAKRKFKDHYIEIDSITATPWGFELFVRAWDKNNKQLGFNKGGRVETERIRFFVSEDSTFLLVKDKKREIKETIYIDDVPIIETFRYDPLEALMNRLEHIVGNITSDGKDIEKGSRGNTVSVIDMTLADSKTVANDNITPYSTCHDATSGNGVYATAANTLNNQIHNSLIGGGYYIRRFDMQFDTSGIGSGQVVSGLTFTQYIASTGSGDTNGYEVDFLDNTNQAGLTSPVVAEDFNDYPTTAIVSKDASDYANAGANVTSPDFGTYGVVDVTGTTRIGQRYSGDIDNLTPTGSNVIRLATGTAGDNPYITVTHADAATSDINSISGVSQANIKSIAGVTNANIKSVAGVANS